MTTTLAATLSLLALPLPTPAMARHKASCVGMATPGRARSVSKLGALGCEAVTRSESDLRITVWVYNYARVPERDLGWAEMAIARVLDQAGITPEWLECPVSKAQVNSRPVCQERMRPTELALVILPSLTSVHPDPGSLLGFSQIFANKNSGHYSYVSYERVEAAARRGAVLYEVLGYVAAHELGHLLLDSDAHSSSGIMRRELEEGNPQDAALGGLSFTVREVQKIRDNAAARMRQRDLASVSQRSVK